MDRPIPGGLSRGLEITARVAIESDPTGGRWVALLEAVERRGCHGSWRRPVADTDRGCDAASAG